MIAGTAFASIPDRDKTINWNMAAPAEITTAYFNKEKVDRYIPYNLTPTNNAVAFGNEFQAKLAQKISDDFFANDQFKNTQAAKMVGDIQQMTSKAVSLGDPATGVVHTFKFQVKAVEGFAQIDYSGFFESSMVYEVGNQRARITISKPLSKDTSISFVDTTSLTAMDFNPNLTLTYNF